MEDGSTLIQPLDDLDNPHYSGGLRDSRRRLQTPRRLRQTQFSEERDQGSTESRPKPGDNKESSRRRRLKIYA